MDIVLVQVPFWGVGGPPLGMALLKSYLKEENISSKIFDLNIHAYNLRGKGNYDWWELKNGYYSFQQDREQMVKYYKDNRSLFLSYIKKIIDLKPKIVGCATYNTSLMLTKIFLEDLRYYYPDCKHILGGPEVAGFMNNAEDLLSKDYIDAVCIDEGERVLAEYFKSVFSKDTKAIAGLVRKEQGKIILGGVTDQIKNLDELPFPDFSDLDMSYYQQPYSIPSYNSRGCVNKCIFCSGRSYMEKFRVRSGQRMFEEFKYLKQLHPDSDYIRLSDNVSNGNIKELTKLCDLIIESGLDVRWTMDNAVIRKEMRTPLYVKMKKAGCILIGYGMETPSHRVLASIGKHLSKGVDIAQVLKEGKKAGIYISANVMHGFPGETDEEADYLLDFVVKNRKVYNMLNPSLTFCEFYPGSLGYDQPEKFGIDLSKGNLFWESTDKTNTYLVRMERFEKLCKIIKKYKIDTLFPVEELPNKAALLVEYYFVHNDFDKAIEWFKRIPENQMTPKIERIYCQMSGKSLPPDLLPDSKFIEDRTSFYIDFMQASLAELIGQIEKVDIVSVESGKAWKIKLRNVVHRIIGYKGLENKINSLYPLMRIFDAKVSSLAEVLKNQK